MVTNKYVRDFSQSKYIDPKLFNHDKYDDYGGLQWMVHNLISSCSGNHIIEGVEISGTVSSLTITEGWVLINGEVVKYNGASNISINPNVFIYIKKSINKFVGELAYGQYYEVENCEGAPICANDNGNMIDLRRYTTPTLAKLFFLKIIRSLTTKDTIVSNKSLFSGNVNISGVITDKNNNPVYGLPIGTVIMYDGDNWVDNTTLPGWYACTGSNGTVNMVGKFIMGKIPSASSSTGGSLDTNHTHDVTTQVSVTAYPSYILPGHSHSKGTISIATSGSHYHLMYTGPGGSGDWIFSANNTGWRVPLTSEPHHHGYGIGDLLGQAGNTGSGNNGDNNITLSRTSDMVLSNPKVSSVGPSDFDKRPPYYTVLFIQRCS